MKRSSFILWGLFFILVCGGLIALNILKFRFKPKDMRELGTPAARLVGHWQLYSRSDLPSYECYFTAATGETRTGQVAMLDKFEDLLLLRGVYRVLEETETGTRMVIHQDLGNQSQREVTILLSKDGLSAQYSYFSGDERFDQRMKYIDDRTTPPSVEALRDAASHSGS